MIELTIRERRALEDAAKHPHGVFKLSAPMNGLGKAANERSAKKLVDGGLIVPNAHGDWYITDEGRQHSADVNTTTKRS